MTTSISFPSKQRAVSRQVIDPLAYLTGPTLTVFRLTLKQGSKDTLLATVPYFDIHVIKLAQNMFMDLRTEKRYRVKSYAGGLKMLYPVAKQSGWIPFRVYNVHKVDTILSLGKEEVIVRKTDQA